MISAELVLVVAMFIWQIIYGLFVLDSWLLNRQKNADVEELAKFRKLGYIKMMEAKGFHFSEADKEAAAGDEEALIKKTISDREGTQKYTPRYRRRKPIHGPEGQASLAEPEKKAAPAAKKKEKKEKKHWPPTEKEMAEMEAS